MKVLVTGAAGFVGYAVAALLVGSGHEVIGLTRSHSSSLPRGVRRVRGDLIRPDSLPEGIADVDAVCHLAGRTRVREPREDPVGYWRSNVGGTLTLLDAITAASRATRLVLASTCGVYGEDAGAPIGETATPQPTSPYGKSKLAADHAAAILAATGRIGAISLRAFNIAGALPGYGHRDRDDTRLIPRLLAVQQNRAPEMVINGDGSAVRDFVHVADMAAAFVLALHTCQPGTWRAYNVGSGQATTVKQVISTVESVTGQPVPRRHAPVAPEPQTLMADNTLIRRELGWRPRRSSLERIITDAWAAVTCA